MKICENGILYDTATAQPLAAFQFSLCGVPAEEAAYRGSEGRCFLVRRIGDHETALLPASEEALLRWQAYREQFTDRLWPGI